MNEETFNISLRKFLKVVGVSSQREVEQAVRAALESGKLKGSETLKAKVVLSIDAVGLKHEVEEEIKLG